MTAETIPHAAIRTMRQLAAPCRFRVIRDSEGGPMIPGRYGQIEYHDSRDLAAKVNLATADDLGGRYFAGREDRLTPSSSNAYLIASV